MVRKKKYHIDIGYWDQPLFFDSFNVYQISDISCTVSQEIPQHRQLCNEITYIVGGLGKMYRNGICYDVGERMLFLSRKGDDHKILSDSTHPLRFISFAFSFNRDSDDWQCAEVINRMFDELDEPTAYSCRDVYPTLVSVVEEATSANTLAVPLIKAYLQQVMILVFRHFRPESELHSAVHRQPNQLIYDMIQYIETYLCEIHSLKDMASELGYSYGYLSKKFSDAMGMTVMNYYTARRLEKASALLRSGHSISDTAEQLCFADTQSFGKAFKKFYRVTPGEYSRGAKH